MSCLLVQDGGSGRLASDALAARMRELTRRRMMAAIPTADVTRYEAEMLSFMRDKHADTLKLIRDSRDFGDDAKKQTVAALEAFAKQFA